MSIFQKPTAEVEQVKRDRLKAIMDALAAAGIEEVTITFDGCGDSGQIDEILVGPEGKALPGEPLTWTRMVHSYGNTEGSIDKWESKWAFEPETGKLADLLEVTVYELLEGKHPGWEINEGSFGGFKFDVKTRKITVEFNQRVETYETEEYEVE